MAAQELLLGVLCLAWQWRKADDLPIAHGFGHIGRRHRFHVQGMACCHRVKTVVGDDEQIGGGHLAMVTQPAQQRRDGRIHLTPRGVGLR